MARFLVIGTLLAASACALSSGDMNVTFAQQPQPGADGLFAPVIKVEPAFSSNSFLIVLPFENVKSYLIEESIIQPPRLGP